MSDYLSLSVYLSLSRSLALFLHMHLSYYLPNYQGAYIYPFIHQSIRLSVCLSVYFLFAIDCALPVSAKQLEMFVAPFTPHVTLLSGQSLQRKAPMVFWYEFFRQRLHGHCEKALFRKYPSEQAVYGLKKLNSRK